MYKVAFEKEAEKEFLKLDQNSQKLVASKIVDLQDGLFSNDKSLKGKHKGKFRKRAGNYRIIYLKENNLLVITIIRVSHRKSVYKN
ncbi:MAG: type II toxin-antitoxin system RelE/ParE family toxin [Proteobacteria bacterium]|nr:type II toxin-antitoxin system RelE/ParE family toxin [Pseudomonadota bacterium]MCH9749843.1 type II toxin-antitoxin system RelE/ParE family toxin [Pseudomonadota bacterium]